MTTLTRGQYAPLLYRSSAAPHSTLPQRAGQVFLRRDLRLAADYFANLPVRAMTPAELLDQIYADLKRQGLEKSVHFGDRIKALIKVLAWSITGEWPRRNIFQKTSTFGGRSSPKHGATSKEDVDITSLEQWQMPDGTPARMTRFLCTDGQDISTAGAPPNMDPETDAAERAAVVHVTTPPSTRFHRKDRAVAAATKARYAAQAIEMEAQQLPVTRTTLTGWDIKSLIAVVEDLDSGEWDNIQINERPSVAAWLAAMFYLGRDDAMLETLQLGESGSSREGTLAEYCRGSRKAQHPSIAEHFDVDDGPAAVLRWQVGRMAGKRFFHTCQGDRGGRAI